MADSPSNVPEQEQQQHHESHQRDYEDVKAQVLARLKDLTQATKKFDEGVRALQHSWMHVAGFCTVRVGSSVFHDSVLCPLVCLCL